MTTFDLVEKESKLAWESRTHSLGKHVTVQPVGTVVIRDRPGACFMWQVLSWWVKILVRMTIMTGVYFTEQQVTSNKRLVNCQQSDGKTWAICQKFCFTKTFSFHTYLSLHSIFWLRKQVRSDMSASDDCVMHKDSGDKVFKLKLSQYVAQWLGIWEWPCGDSGTNNLQQQNEL